VYNRRPCFWPRRVHDADQAKQRHPLLAPAWKCAYFRAIAQKAQAFSRYAPLDVLQGVAH
jgi:hypothetical protein